jgi:hypothetical protein
MSPVKWGVTTRAPNPVVFAIIVAVAGGDGAAGRRTLADVAVLVASTGSPQLVNGE